MHMNTDQNIRAKTLIRVDSRKSSAFSWPVTLDWSIIASLAFLVLLGFGLRATQLGAVGFAEDEMNKLDVIHAYERGDFSANSEHPMVMKLLMWASLRGLPASSEEAALRFPNALIGALTVIPLFLLTAAL